jgi:hypothetical protein
MTMASKYLLSVDYKRVRKALWSKLSTGDRVYVRQESDGKVFAVGPFTVELSMNRVLLDPRTGKLEKHSQEDLYIEDSYRSYYDPNSNV